MLFRSIPYRSLRQRGAWSLSPERAAPLYYPSSLMIGVNWVTKRRLVCKQRERRRASVWTHQEADITTIEHEVTSGHYQKRVLEHQSSALLVLADVGKRIEETQLRLQRLRRSRYRKSLCAKSPKNGNIAVGGRRLSVDSRRSSALSETNRRVIMHKIPYSKGIQLRSCKLS